jgi:PAS domain S-box-containing protein
MADAARAGSLQVVYDAALRGVQEALHVERTALLVFDAGGTMRFVASAGISDAYRRAVDGHSPWSITDTAATSLLISDVEQVESLADFVPILRQEGIRALAFVPVQFGTRLLGKFMLYYREPHAFSEAEVATAEQIADHVAFALEHHRIAVALESRLLEERQLREQAERDAALREANERRLELALTAGRMGAWDWDLRSGGITWSSELEGIHGLALGTFEGTLDAFRRDVHPADAERVEAVIAAALAAPEATYGIEYRIVRPDGSVRWLGATGRVIVGGDGQPCRMVGICRDVTERKRAEDAGAFVANASRVLATTLAPDTIIENLSRLVVPTLADWCIVQVADAEVGLHPVEITHRDDRLKALMWELLQRWPGSVDYEGSAASVASRGRSVLIPRITEEMLQGRVDATFVPALRDMRLCSAITVPLQARGRTLGALTLMTAESGRLYDEADRRFAEEIGSWAAIAIDNGQLYGEARAAVRARDEMVAFLSHDLRDPLQSISAAAAALRLQGYAIESGGDVECIARASAQMQRLVDDLLDVSTIEPGRLAIKREPVELRDLMVELRTIAAPRMRAKDARIEVELPADLPTLAVDRHRVLEVLLNLVGNALKFGGPGVVVTLGAEREADAIRVWVRDTGKGIGPEHISRVFDRFWRSDRREGAGLGLAIAKGIVEAHGGRIGVTSEPGVGSTFFFTLPVQPFEALPAPGGPPAEAARGHQPLRSRRVLLVDDDRSVARSLLRLLRMLGHDVHVAFSGEAALADSEHFRPDIVLMDVTLPGRNGYDTAREMRSKAWSEGVSFVAMTGWARETDRRRALDAGFDQHVIKPVSADTLETLLRMPTPVR